MANLGAGETFVGYLIKSSEITTVNSFIKDNSVEALATCEAVKSFRYRYMSANESITQALPSWLKGKLSDVIFTSETDIDPRLNDIIYLEIDYKKRVINSVIPQRQLGMFALSKKFPFVLELN